MSKTRLSIKALHPHNNDLGRNTMRVNIRNFICAQIQKGIYKPGARIIETKLARELNVSQAPVREAILELTVMGLLEVRPYYGTYVRNITPDDIEDIYYTRAFIEQYAAQLAAKRATAEQLLLFEPIISEMELAVQKNNKAAFVDPDMRFHELIMDCAFSKALKHVWQDLRFAVWTYLTSTVTKKSLNELLATHKEIYGYISRHEDQSAGAAMFLHISNFKNELIENYIMRNSM